MKTLMLYCDLSTMRCNAEDINNILKDISGSYVQASDSLWFFTYEKNMNNGSMLAMEIDVFTDYLEQYVTDESIVFIETLSDRYYYQLPDKSHDFLSENP